MKSDLKIWWGLAVALFLVLIVIAWLQQSGTLMLSFGASTLYSAIFGGGGLIIGIIALIKTVLYFVRGKNLSPNDQVEPKRGLNFKVVALVLILVIIGILVYAFKSNGPSNSASMSPNLSLGAYPNIVKQGQATTLTWSVSPANWQVNISNLGNVSSSGSRKVTVYTTTTYTLTATYGNQTKNVDVTVEVNPNATGQ